MRRRMPRWLIAMAALVYVFLHVPLLVLVVFSFNDSKYSVEWKGFTWRWYERLLERADIIDALEVSLLVGGVATVVATVLGTLMALGLARHRFRGRTATESMLYIPVVTPEIVFGISLLILFVAAGIDLGRATIIIAHISFNISFVAIVVRARLEGMDENLEEAALILGADEWTTFWRVTVPQLWPGILSGALLAFTMSFDDFVITSLVSGPGSSTLPLVIYGMVRRTIEPSINALSTIILVVTTTLIFAADRLGQRQRPATR
jgi:spermidine/putrescine transport system permease protein